MAALVQAFGEELPNGHADQQVRGIVGHVQVEEAAKDNAEQERQREGPDQRPANAQEGFLVPIRDIVLDERKPEIAHLPDSVEILETRGHGPIHRVHLVWPPAVYRLTEPNAANPSRKRNRFTAFIGSFGGSSLLQVPNWLESAQSWHLAQLAEKGIDLANVLNRHCIRTEDTIDANPNDYDGYDGLASEVAKEGLHDTAD